MKRYLEFDNEICPVCGYYCVGKGGRGCIDKPCLTGIRERTTPMNELKRLIDEYETKVVTQAECSKEEYYTHYYHALNKAIEEAQQAKQALLDYIKENYEVKK